MLNVDEIVDSGSAVTPCMSRVQARASGKANEHTAWAQIVDMACTAAALSELGHAAATHEETALMNVRSPQRHAKSVWLQPPALDPSALKTQDCAQAKRALVSYKPTRV
jgi:hypothetical protein